MDEKRDCEARHRLDLMGRKTLSVEGVTDVDTFNDNRLLVRTTMGNLWVKGTGLHIRLLNVEEGKLEVDGQVNSLEYLEKEGAGHKNFFRRIFR